MRKKHTLQLSHPAIFKQKLLLWSKGFSHVAYLENCQYKPYAALPNTYSSVECLVGLGAVQQITADYTRAFSDLQQLVDACNDWLFGFLGYDLKNGLENLSSNNADHIGLPDLAFFRARYVFIFDGETLTVEYLPQQNTLADVQALLQAIEATACPAFVAQHIQTHARFSKQEYLDTVAQIKKHIQAGDIYEMNLCQEFFATDVALEAEQSFWALRKKSPAPFMAFTKFENNYVLSASPERFVKKVGKQLISQPMKGTSKRSAILAQDKHNKAYLASNPKERAENVMIVDLVRNDLARIAATGSVQVSELCGVYSFAFVHQMISTVLATLPPDRQLSDVLRACFPMGSMTGAPKIRAMELIEQYERTKRGLFSGAIGYISPHGNFDFNVVIRSLLYNAENKYVSVQVGSAITSLAIAEHEYEECMLKANSLLSVFEQNK